MVSNLDRYNDDLKNLVSKGSLLFNSMQYVAFPKDFRKMLEKHFKPEEVKGVIDMLPNFQQEYQTWYSEALSVLKIVLPDRVSDFVRLYEKPKNRKSVEYGNYVIEDYLQNLSVTRGVDRIVGPEAAIHQFEQQLNILKAARSRFGSSLFEIKQLLQADLFDAELHSARELRDKGFLRPAGTLSGVVLEKHLSQVCNSHNLRISKKEPSINDYNQLLKDNNIIDIKEWRYIQYLADSRNLCSHNKEKEPEPNEVDELVEGVEKVIKRVY